MDQKYKFYYPLLVRYFDTDAQGHVFFGNYLNYFDVGLLEYMRAIGYSYVDMVALGVDMFIIEASCQYKGQSRFDDLLHVHTRIGHIGNTSFTFEFAIYKQPDDGLIAAGKRSSLSQWMPRRSSPSACPMSCEKRWCGSRESRSVASRANCEG